MLKYPLTCHTKIVTLYFPASLINNYISTKDIVFLLILCFFFSNNWFIHFNEVISETLSDLHFWFFITFMTLLDNGYQKQQRKNWCLYGKTLTYSFLNKWKKVWNFVQNDCTLSFPTKFRTFWWFWRVYTTIWRCVLPRSSPT